MHKNILFALIFLISFTNCDRSEAQLNVARIFGEHMILQRGEPVKIWGTGSPNDVLVFSFDGQDQMSKIDAQGKWEIIIPAQEAGGPHQISIASARKNFDWKDVYFGDVYLCSGQSNMEWPLYLSENGKKEISVRHDGLIRQYKVPRSFSDTLSENLAIGNWTMSSSADIKEFTAVGYYFAKQIKKSEGVPVGLINSSWGGARIEPWMSATALGAKDSKEILKEIRAKEAHAIELTKRKLLTAFGPFKSVDKALSEKTVNWEEANIDMKGWQPLRLNVNWENEGYENVDGVMWYRNTFSLTKSERKQDYILQLGTIDDSDQTFINGIQVGETINGYNKERNYAVSNTLLKIGENVVAVRVEDLGGSGGINNSAVKIGMKSKTGFISLADHWKIRLEALYNFGLYSENKIPTILFNKMIYPLRNFPIKGILWYQGESNADQDRETYGNLFKGLIQDWRRLWGDEDLPFLYVQLAAFQAAPMDPEYSSWPAIRMAQTDALALDNTGMAVAIDIGDADDIHPRNKMEVGRRLALSAQHLIYGKALTSRGPNPSHIKKIGKEIFIEYNDSDGLYFKNNNLSERQFSVAGANGKYYWAIPRIEKNQIVLTCPEVENPFEVRYAWASNPDQASLYNSSNLPAEPFTKKIN